MKIFWVSDIGPCEEQERRLKELHGDEVEIVPTSPQGVSLGKLRGGVVYISLCQVSTASVLLAKLSGLRYGVITGRDISWPG